jgi:hypothetical protein
MIRVSVVIFVASENSMFFKTASECAALSADLQLSGERLDALRAQHQREEAAYAYAFEGTSANEYDQGDRAISWMPPLGN